MTDRTAQVRQFVVDNFLFGAPDPHFTDDQSFLESGVIDSLGMLEIVTWIEEKFGISVPETDLTPENLGSVRRVATYIERRSATR